MSYIEYKSIIKSIVVLATQKLCMKLLLAKMGIDRYVAYGIIKLPTKPIRR